MYRTVCNNIFQRSDDKQWQKAVTASEQNIELRWTEQWILIAMEHVENVWWKATTAKNYD